MSKSKVAKWVFRSCIGSVLLPLASCTHSAEEENGKYDAVRIVIPDVIEKTSSCIVDGIAYLPLYGSESRTMSEPAKVRFENGCYYILYKRQHSIAVFGNDGHFMFSISSRGKAYNEYQEIANFTVDERKVYVIDNCRHSICMYDATDGSFVGRKEIPFVSWDIECLGENRFLHTCLPNNPRSEINASQGHYAVWETDSTFQAILAGHFPYDGDYFEPIGRDAYFSKCEDGVFFCSFLTEGAVLFSKGETKPRRCNVTLPNPIPKGERPSFEEITSRGYGYLCEVPHATRDYLFLDVASGSEDEVIAIRRDSLHETFRNADSDIATAILPLTCAIGDKVAAYLSYYGLYEDLASEGFRQCPPAVDSLLRNGGACLLVYSFK